MYLMALIDELGLCDLRGRASSRVDILRHKNYGLSWMYPNGPIIHRDRRDVVSGDRFSGRLPQKVH